MCLASCNSQVTLFNIRAIRHTGINKFFCYFPVGFEFDLNLHPTTSPIDFGVLPLYRVLSFFGIGHKLCGHQPPHFNAISFSRNYEASRIMQLLNIFSNLTFILFPFYSISLRPVIGNFVTFIRE